MTAYTEGALGTSAKVRRTLTLGGIKRPPGDRLDEEEWGALPVGKRAVFVRAGYVYPEFGQPAGDASPSFACKRCGREFSSAQALGGHERGHVKRGEV